jgi:dihydrofolate synthase/folylpolyglutamate synthase
VPFDPSLSLASASTLLEPSPVFTYDEALARLYGRINYERVPQHDYCASMFKLERMSALLDLCGHPELDIPAVHIAGTKGKGSTAAMTAAMLQAAGYRTGLFISPHVHRFEERMTVNGEGPTPAELAELYTEVHQLVQRLEDRGPDWSPTFFEVTTTLAWLFFARRGAELAVLEVGLGGRLDATNVCRPLVTVVTSISHDHTHLLGETLEQIAREKAGIIKTGVPVVSGVREEPARGVIGAVARERGAALLQLGDDLCLSELSYAASPDADGLPRAKLNVATPWRVHAGVEAPLPGRHQACNAALALAAVDSLAAGGFPVAPEAIRAGLAAVDWPLRIEVLGRRPLVVADAAHNEASIAAMLATLRGLAVRRRVLVFGASRDKHVDDMLRLINGEFDDVVLTQYAGNPRALSARDLAVRAGSAGLTGFRVESSARAAWDLATSLAAPEDLICATGSLFLAAELRELILTQATVRRSCPPVSALPLP